MAEISIDTGDGSRERFPLANERVTIGRSRDSDIFLPDQWLSRHHAEILKKDANFFLHDLGSKNGTLLNGEPVHGDRRLRHGDVITLGEHVLTFSIEEVDEDSQPPEGTRIFSARELSDIKTKPSIDPEELQRQNRVLEVLSQAARSLLAHRPLPDLFEDVLNLLFAAVPCERGAILLLEGTPPEPTVKASRSRGGQPLLAKVSRSIARRVLERRETMLLPNLMEDTAFSTQDSILSTGIRSALCAPLWFTSASAEQDAVIGLVYLDSLAMNRPFSEEDARIVTALANVAAAKIENVRLLEESMEKRRLEEDMRVAAEIQRGLLPDGAPVVAGYGVVGSNRPCRTVGGDYYDFSLSDGRLLMALGDVSGKGTGAALLMTVLRAAVRGHWADESVAEAVARINSTVCQNVTAGKYITFFLARLDPGSGRVDYVNAGHNPPLLIRRDGTIETLNEGGMVLGLFDSMPYGEGIAELRTGDTLLIFSDGVTETWSAKGDEFGDQRLGEVAVRGRGLDAANLQTEILRELEVFEAGTKATDDRTLIVLKRY
ncbi:MAG TPA: SpoIIE family protein phosphatase [Vicinamibacteria bacterium]|jgi:sigma-B regulation protein RsbU (phosphoserine phosphatase)|nr:SpoIIE family protein phosphatase [Vicinamibacteria bacterium]